MREDQRGHYYGVGMVIQQQGNKVYVITPYEDTPSFRAGIRPGDDITSIDGKSADGMIQTRWPKRSKALRVPRSGHHGPRRPGQAAGLRPHPRRNSSPLGGPSFEIHPGVGYIHLTQFQETTGQEIIEALTTSAT